MKIYLMRHGKVDFKWESFYTSEAFDRACAEYDQADILPVEKQELDLDAVKTVYVSGLKRTAQTAQIIFPDKQMVCLEMIHEVPLRSAFDTTKQIPLFCFNVLGRMQWLLGNTRQPEIRRQTLKRARKALETVAQKQEDCILVTHGFFMKSLMKELKNMGFKVEKAHVFLSNLEVVTATKE